MNVTIITDASYCPDLKVGGYGFWIASQRGKLGGGSKLTWKGGAINTSTIAEMMAISGALYIAVSNKLVLQGDSVLFQTDCMGAIQAFQGTRYNLVSQELSVLKYHNEMQNSLQLQIRYKHVKGHSQVDDARSASNRLCDKQAKQYMRAARTIVRAQSLKTLMLKG